MNLLREAWFWFSIIICPILMVASLYNMGYLVGYLTYVDFNHLTNEQVTRLLIVAAGLVSIVFFIQGLKQARIRFSSSQ